MEPLVTQGVRMKPPLGVEPYWLWKGRFPNPDISEIVKRYVAVAEAVFRYRAAGQSGLKLWFVELGLLDPDPSIKKLEHW